MYDSHCVMAFVCIRILYVSSLMSCSINKSQMFFTCKNVMFSNFTWKKKYFALVNGGGIGAPPAPLFSTALIRVTYYKFNINFTMYMLTNFNMLFKNVCRWETDFFYISDVF